MKKHHQVWQGALLASLFSLLLAPQLARAQGAEGTILGHVMDPSGESVPGATVTVKNLGTNVTNTFKTPASGDYVVPDLIPGRYQVTVEAKGFHTAVGAPVSLSVDQTLRQDFSLKLGEATQKVTVSGRAQMLQSASDTVGTVLHSTLIESLPINGRDVTDLLQDVAGSTTMPGGSVLYWSQHPLSPEFTETSVNGADPDSISYSVDGVIDTEQFFSAISDLPGEDAVQEMKVQNGLYGAEYGYGSTQVNIAIKSGANQIHGSGFDFIQNSVFQPNNQKQQTLNNLDDTHLPLKTQFNQNMFGGDVGGPVILPWIYNGRNKTFFFFDYEGGREATAGSVQEYQLPTTAERNGDFSDWPYPIYNPATTGSVPATTNDPSGRTVFSGNQIPSGDFNPIATKLASYYPTPNVTCAMPCDNYSTVLPSTLTDNTETFRVDQNFGEKNRIFFTGIVSQILTPGTNIIPVDAADTFTHSRLFGLNWEHTFGSQTFNEARVGYNRNLYNDGAVSAFGPDLSSQLGLANVPNSPSLFGLPGVSLAGGYTGIGNTNGTMVDKDNIFEYADDLTMIRGKHTIIVGTDNRRIQLWDVGAYEGDGTLSFTGAYTASNPLNNGAAGPYFGNAFADMLLGDPLGASDPAPVAAIVNVRGTEWGLFAQDTYQMTPRLTLIGGLRYDIPPNYHSTDLSGWTNSFSNGGQMVWASSSFVNTYSKTPGADPNYLVCCAPSTLAPNDRLDFAPRLGIAFRPFRNNANLVVRAGYGIFYDNWERYYDLSNYTEDDIYTAVGAPIPPATGFESVSPLALKGLWLPPLLSGSIFTTPSYEFGIETEWPDNHNPNNQQWNLDVQYAFNKNLMLDVGYVGEHGIDEETQYFWNYATPPPVANDACNYLLDASLATGSDAYCASDPNFVPVDKRTPYPNIAAGSYANANVLWSHYNALQATLSQRFSSGLTFNLAYTRTKASDEQPALINAIGTAEDDLLENPHCIACDYGPATFSQTNRLVGSFSYQLPVGSGMRWSLGHHLNSIFGGWQTSGVYTIASGYPFTIFCCSGQDQFGGDWAGIIRPNLVGKQVVTGNPLEWFNTAAYATPPVGRYGNLGANTLTGPYVEDLDFSLQKNFNITERQRLAYRLEIFNLGSTWHSFYGGSYDDPSSNMTSSPVGCTPGPSGTCDFGSIVPLNGLGAGNLWNPRILQMSLTYSF